MNNPLSNIVLANYQSTVCFQNSRQILFDSQQIYFAFDLIDVNIHESWFKLIA